jgi:hypothetical protein
VENIFRRSIIPLPGESISPYIIGIKVLPLREEPFLKDLRDGPLGPNIKG